MGIVCNGKLVDKRLYRQIHGVKVETEICSDLNVCHFVLDQYSWIPNYYIWKAFDCVNMELSPFFGSQ
jgi:hypothetical protein